MSITVTREHHAQIKLDRLTVRARRASLATGHFVKIWMSVLLASMHAIGMQNVPTALEATYVNVRADFLIHILPMGHHVRILMNVLVEFTTATVTVLIVITSPAVLNATAKEDLKASEL